MNLCPSYCILKIQSLALLWNVCLGFSSWEYYLKGLWWFGSPISNITGKCLKADIILLRGQGLWTQHLSKAIHSTSHLPPTTLGINLWPPQACAYTPPQTYVYTVGWGWGDISWENDMMHLTSEFGTSAAIQKVGYSVCLWPQGRGRVADPRD